MTVFSSFPPATVWFICTDKRERKRCRIKGIVAVVLCLSPHRRERERDTNRVREIVAVAFCHRKFFKLSFVTHSSLGI